MFDRNLKNYVDWRVRQVKKIKQGYGFLVVLIYSDGNKREQQRSGYRTKKEAEKARENTIGELYSGNYVVYQNVTVADFMAFWLEEDIRKRCRSQTYYSFSTVIKKHILPEMGGKRMSVVSSADIQALYNRKAEYSVSVAQQIKVVIGLAMRYALSMKVIATDPSVGILLPKKAKTQIRTKGYHMRSIDVQKTLSYEQISLLIEKSYDTPIYIMVLFNVLMGLRRGEIVALKYSDIDPVHRTISIQRQLGKKMDADQGRYVFGTITKQEAPTKTRSSIRTLPIPDYVYEAIQTEREKYERNREKYGARFEDSGYICCSSYGKPRSPGYHWKYYKKLLRDNGLPDIRWHDLRSTYCTLLLKNEFSPKAVSQLLGHSKEIITVDVYGDRQEIISDGVPEIEAFMKEVLPERQERIENDHTDVVMDITEYIPTRKEP